MKKVLLLVVVIVAMLTFSGVVFAGGSSNGYKVAYSAMYNKIYDITMPDVNGANVIATTNDGLWYCGDNQAEVKTSFTNFVYVQSLPGLTKYSAGNISLTGSIDPNYDPMNITTGFLSFDYDKKLAKIAFFHLTTIKNWPRLPTQPSTVSSLTKKTAILFLAHAHARRQAARSHAKMFIIT
jgi:hypothetical protein